MEAQNSDIKRIIFLLLVTAACLGPSPRALAQGDVNLRLTDRAGWYAPVVPLGGAWATPTSCSLYTYRISVPQFYWNAHGENLGGDATPGGFDVSVYLDGAWKGIGYAGATAGEFAVINQGPVSADICGRHTLSCYVDALHSVAETNENDNVWGGQYIWDFLPLYADGASVVHVAPPDPTGGWEHIVDGSTPQENCDGYLTYAAGPQWHAIAVAAADAGDDYGARLYDFDDSDPVGGFYTLQASSDRSAGLLDVVFYNRESDPFFSATYNVAVVNANDGDSDYRITRRDGYALPFATEVSFSLDGDEFLDIWGVSLEAAQQGPVTAVLEADPESGLHLVRLAPRDVGWYTWEGALSDAAATAPLDADGQARLDFAIIDDREHALVVYRDPGVTTGPVSGTIRLVPPTPELEFHEAAWWSPLVPSAAVMTNNVVVLPAELPGNVVGTYHNYLIRNDGLAGTGSFTNRLLLDGVLAHDVLYLAGVAAGTTQPYWQQYAEQVRGGRHTLSLLLDVHGNVTELNEDNNAYGEQYCWTPLALAYGTPVTRATPPLPTGGANHLPAGAAFLPNCDGVRMPSMTIALRKNGWWRGVSAMPTASGDAELALHAACTGPKAGFAEALALSQQPAGTLEYVLVNFHQTENAAYDAGIRRAGIGGSVTVEAVASMWLSAPSSADHGPYTLQEGHALQIFDLFLDPGLYAFRLDNLSGTGRLGLSLHDTAESYQARGVGVVPDGQAVAAAAGGDAFFTVTVASAGSYGLTVWKEDAADLGVAASYRLRILPDVSAAGDAPTAGVTGLCGAWPNPFNPRTQLAFHLDRARQVTIAVYDLKGRLVRTLLDEHRGPGRHEIAWEGTDDRGRGLPSGVYLARMSADGDMSRQRLTLVR